MKKSFSEFIGTFALVFAGTGAFVVDEVSHGAATHLGVALPFGLIVLATIYALGDVSGAHLNPAVTLGFVRGGKDAGKGGAGLYGEPMRRGGRRQRSWPCRPRSFSKKQKLYENHAVQVPTNIPS